MAAAAAIMVTWTRDGPAEEDPPSPCDLAILTQGSFPSTLGTMLFRVKICGGGKEGWPCKGKASRAVQLCGACCCSAPFHKWHLLVLLCHLGRQHILLSVTYTFGQGELMTYSRPRPRHRRTGRTANRTVLWSGVVLCRCSCLHGGVVCACGHEYAYPVRPGGDTYYLLPGLLGARGPRAAFCGGGRGAM